MQQREVYQAYYTNSRPIVTYMTSMLAARAGMRIMEPAAGNGVFVEAIIDTTHDVQIDAYDLNPVAIGVLKENFSTSKNVFIKHADTIVDDELTFFAQMGGIYDRIIGNPPYGAWQDYERRKDLKKIYPEIYVKETYALFLFRCVNLLVDGGKLVFIVPDTFLSLHMHTGLRKYLLTNTKIKEIALFPSSFFPHVNFGYSNLAIITLERCFNKEECLSNVFRIVSGFQRVEELATPELAGHTAMFAQKGVYAHPDNAFFSSSSEVSQFIHTSQLRTGDIADCVTGIYSGNDTKYLRPLSSEVRNSKKYVLLDKKRVFPGEIYEANILDGINAPECFIPIVKGGAVKYLKPDNWYIDWSKEAVRDYKTNKKARFQNSSFYFKTGIAVPMVSSSQVTASLIENRIFDQSIVGIFPRDPELLYYLLAFFNSPTCNKLLRTINPSANNSANYIKKIPFILPPDEIVSAITLEVREIIRELREYKMYDVRHEVRANKVVEDVYGF